MVKSKGSRTRVPKLKFTRLRDIGWHVSYRDRATRTPRRHRFGILEREREAEARILYHAWVLEHLGGNGTTTHPTTVAPPVRRKLSPEVLSGSLLEIGSALIESERSRSRIGDEPRRQGTIAAPVFRDRKKQIHDFLAFLNERHGPGAVARMRLADLSMDDVEQFNRHIAKDFSASQVGKRIQLVKAIIDRAGRPEHGNQVLGWNWDSRDVVHGKPTVERTFPTRRQLVRLLRGSDFRGRTMIWLGIGLGFGARDLAAIRVGQIAKDAYDLRRSKTGIERYGHTPPRVWRYVSLYQNRRRRPPGEFLFLTRTGTPLVHPKSNAVTQWWDIAGVRDANRIPRLAGDRRQGMTHRQALKVQLGGVVGGPAGVWAVDSVWADFQRSGNHSSSRLTGVVARPVSSWVR